MTKHRNPIAGPCAPSTMFTTLQRRGIGRIESTVLWNIAILPVNFALVQERGEREWGCLIRETAATVRPGYDPTYTLAAPRNPQQRQRRRVVESRNWLVLIEVEP